MRFLPRLSRSPHTTLHTQARRGAQANPNKRAKAAQLPQNAKRFSASSHAALHGLDEEDDAQPASSELPPANSIVTLVENRKYEVGIASLSTDDYTVQIGQFCDDQAYSKTLALMTRYEPRIIVFPEWLPSEPNGTVLERICRNEYASARIEHLPRKYWQDVKGMQHARHFSPRSELSALETDISSKYLCLSALAAIIDYAEYQAKMAFVKGTLRIRFSSVEGIMLLDPATVANLELLRNVRTGDTKTSLFGVLNHCKTGAGSRMLRAALIQPSTDMDTITARHDCVVELIAREDALVDLQKILPTLADCDRMLKLFIERQNISDSAARSEACISAVLQLKQVLHTVPCLAAALSENDQRPPKNELLQKVRRPLPRARLDLPGSPCLPLHPPHATPPPCPSLRSQRRPHPRPTQVLQNLLAPELAQLLQWIDEIVEVDAVFDRRSSQRLLQCLFSVKPGVKTTLDLCRQTLGESTQEMERLLESYHAALSLTELRLNYNQRRGYHFVLPASQRRLAEENGFIQMQATSSKKSISCTTEPLSQLNLRCREMVTLTLTLALTLLPTLTLALTLTRSARSCSRPRRRWRGSSRRSSSRCTCSSR